MRIPLDHHCGISSQPRTSALCISKLCLLERADVTEAHLCCAGRAHRMPPLLLPVQVRSSTSTKNPFRQSGTRARAAHITSKPEGSSTHISLEPCQIASGRPRLDMWRSNMWLSDRMDMSSGKTWSKKVSASYSPASSHSCSTLFALSLSLRKWSSCGTERARRHALPCFQHRPSWTPTSSVLSGFGQL